MITKPSNTKIPLIVTSSGTISSSAKEIVSLHFTATGAGTCTVHDGSGNGGIVLSVDAASGSDDWSPAQPARFEKIIVAFSGTGTLAIQYQ